MKPEQITAWALDEASAEERLQLEAELREYPAVQKCAVETKDFCAFLLAELRDDSLELTDEQRERLKLVAAAGGKPVTAAEAQPKALDTAKRTVRKNPKWRASIVLRLGLAACLTVGCVIVWQQHDQKLHRETAAMNAPLPVDAKKFPVKMPSASLPGMPVPSDPKRRTVAERVKEPLLPEAQPLPGSQPPGSTQTAIPALPATSLPGASASMLAGTTSMTPGDKAKLGQLQDEVTYGVGIDPSKVMLLTNNSSASGGLGARVTAPTPIQGAATIVNSAAGGSPVAIGTTLAGVGASGYNGSSGSIIQYSEPTAHIVGASGGGTVNSGTLAAAAPVAGSTALGSGTVNTLTLAGGGVVGTQTAVTTTIGGMTQTAAIRAEPALVSGPSVAVVTPSIGGIVPDAGAPLTINGGWTGPPSVAVDPRFGGNANAGSLSFAAASGAPGPSAPVFRNVGASLDVGYGNHYHVVGTTKFLAGALSLPASPPALTIGTASMGQTPTASATNTVGSLTTPQAVLGEKSQVEAVHKGLLLANSSVELGNYDTAISQYQDVLRVDPYNAAVRHGMEEAEKKRQSYFQAAYEHQRAKMMAQVDEKWEDKVLVGTATGNMAAVTGDFASTLTDNNPQPDSRYFSPTPLPQSEPKPRTQAEGPVSESYQRIVENELKDVAREPLSTFSIDVDTAAYANMRRFLNQGAIPPADAVRIEELINYFPTAEEGLAPGAKEPFGVRVEMAPCPWQPQHRLARIAIKGRELGAERKASNLVFLVDVSGSMGEPAKLPLVQQSLRMLTQQLGEGDRVTMVVYAGSSGLVLPPTNGEDKQAILAAIDRLQSGGSTHGSAGIQLAYEQAVAGFIKDGVNRVILCTDGDFNVGVSSPEELEKLITRKAKSGVFLSVLGFGSGNLKDRTMETLADKGNGNYAYIDSLSEARKVLVEQMSGTLVTIAKDVKIQVEFNPAAVRSYRLIGYENRLMAKEDFNDDTKDAGEIGAGHSVVALYEVVPANLPAGAEPRPLVDNLRYQQNVSTIPPAQLADAAKNGEVMTVKLRYKEPDSSLSKLIEVPAKDEGKTLTASTQEFKFSAAVAGFGLLLRDSAYKGTLGWETVRKLALDGKGSDKLGYRGEFLQLIDKARGLKEVRE